MCIDLNQKRGEKPDSMSRFDKVFLIKLIFTGEKQSLKIKH